MFPWRSNGVPKHPFLYHGTDILQFRPLQYSSTLDCSKWCPMILINLRSNKPLLKWLRNYYTQSPHFENAAMELDLEIVFILWMVFAIKNFHNISPEVYSLET